MILYCYLNCKTTSLLCIATMWKSRFDIGTLQARNIEFSYINEGSSITRIVTGMALHIRQSKEKPVKSSKTWDD
ncbi:hypothetical protein BCV71DRAFT_101929 [Rhizopus microsporus]|uniref:Uncharacterized protein n=1 Tax=Rhizopus microsporus TaxID=58291 RepID=A0A1X0S554_RHIZD|nr:hypothetical protein BCV71DRAFT_101929 [Rhizopus microsporus]